jgi:hypothetical protein
MHDFAGERGGKTLRIEIDITNTSLICFWFRHVLNLFSLTTLESWLTVIGTTDTHPVCVLDTPRIIGDCRGE